MPLKVVPSAATCESCRKKTDMHAPASKRSWVKEHNTMSKALRRSKVETLVKEPLREIKSSHIY